MQTWVPSQCSICGSQRGWHGWHDQFTAWIATSQVAKPARHAACWPPCARCGPSSPPQIAMGPPPAGMACWDTTAPGAGNGWWMDGEGGTFWKIHGNGWMWRVCSLAWVVPAFGFASRIRLFKRCCKPTKPSASIYIYMYSILSDQPYANHGQDPSIDPIGPMMIQS